ncbi:MAG: glycosyltransferase family 4 protein [Armatimonadota bacterium]|nr:glycosyltransferase family 4 protein [bacterium]
MGSLANDMLNSRNGSKNGKILIIVENLSVPFDRRVWAESLALTEAGYKVSVICPNGQNSELKEIIDGVSIYRYPAPIESAGVIGYIKEFAYSLLAAFRLSLVVRRHEGFDAIQVCNPPDILFLIGLFHKVFGRKKIVFDHHDLSPELFSLKFDPDKKSFAYKMLLWLERRTFKAADMVISTNESFKQIAMIRGGKPVNSVFVVRNGPDLRKFTPCAPNADLKFGKEYMVCYVGVMATQDGIDYLLRAINHVVNTRGRTDVAFVLIGSGDILDELKQLAVELGIADYVVFTGRINDDKQLATYISTSDICVAPDPKNDLNDNCTLIKIAEYMAIGKPVVSFDLKESRYTAKEAALYAENNDCTDFGEKIIQLLDSPAIREKMGAFGRRRIVESLSWDNSKCALLHAYGILFGVDNDSPVIAEGYQ